MTVRGTTRRRALAAVTMALAAAGATAAQVALPPLVITSPVPPVHVETTAREVAPAPRMQVIVVPTVMKSEPPPVVVVPTVLATKEPPIAVIAPAVVVPPVVPAVTVSRAKSAKPALAEIISAGPKPVDASASFTTALKDAKAALGKVRDYSGHVLLQERVKGQLQAEQTAELRVRTQPKSVAVRFIAPSSAVGRELIFVDGSYANKVRVKAAGTYGPLAFASVLMSDPKTAVTGKLTLADVGVAAALDRVEHALALEAKLRNPVSVTVADFTFAGKTVTRYEICCDRPHALRDAARLVVCVDPATKLPVRLEAYDPPAAGKLEGELREAISFVNLSFNQGLGDGPFEK